MKHTNFFTFILLIIAACIGFASCDKDNNADETNINKIIVGQWASQFIDEVSYIDIKTLDLHDLSIDAPESYITFKSNGEGYEIYDNYRYDFTYQISKDMLYATADDKSESASIKILKYNNNVIYSLNQSEQTVFKLVKVK